MESETGRGTVVTVQLPSVSYRKDIFARSASRHDQHLLLSPPPAEQPHRRLHLAVGEGPPPGLGHRPEHGPGDLVAQLLVDVATGDVERVTPKLQPILLQPPNTSSRISSVT